VFNCSGLFAFDLYDLDSNERMDREEAHVLLRDIYGRYYEKSGNAKRYVLNCLSRRAIWSRILASIHRCIHENLL
jgi:hypothetical protein